jgi:hypothetical protein
MEAEAAEEWLPPAAAAASAAAAAAAPSASQRRAAKARAGGRKRVKRAKLSSIARSSTAGGSFALPPAVLAPYTPRRKAAARADALRLEAQQPAWPVRKPPAPKATNNGESIHSMQLSAPLSDTAGPGSATAVQHDDHTSAARGVTAAVLFQAHACSQQLGRTCSCMQCCRTPGGFDKHCVVLQMVLARPWAAAASFLVTWILRIARSGCERTRLSST